MRRISGGDTKTDSGGGNGWMRRGCGGGWMRRGCGRGCANARGVKERRVACGDGSERRRGGEMGLGQIKKRKGEEESGRRNGRNKNGKIDFSRVSQQKKVTKMA